VASLVILLLSALSMTLFAASTCPFYEKAWMLHHMVLQSLCEHNYVPP